MVRDSLRGMSPYELLAGLEYYEEKIDFIIDILPHNKHELSRDELISILAQVEDCLLDTTREKVFYEAIQKIDIKVE